MLPRKSSSLFALTLAGVLVNISPSYSNPLSHPGPGINSPSPDVLGSSKIWISASTQIPNLGTDFGKVTASNFSAAYGLLGYAQLGLLVTNNGFNGARLCGEMQVNPFPKGLAGLAGWNAALGLRNISDRKQVGALDAPFQSTAKEALGDINSNSFYLVLGHSKIKIVHLNLGWGLNEFEGHGRLNHNLHGLFGSGSLNLPLVTLLGEIDGRAFNVGSLVKVKGFGIKGAWMGVENTTSKRARQAGQRSSIGLQLSREF